MTDHRPGAEIRARLMAGCVTLAACAALWPASAAALPDPTWLDPVVVGNGGGGVTVLATPQGRIIAGAGGGNTILVAIHDPGGTWSTAQPIAPAADTVEGAPSVVVTPAGDIVIAADFVRGGAHGVEVVTLAAGSRQWSAPERLSTAPDETFQPALASAADGSVYLALIHNDGATNRVRLVRRGPDEADFGAPVDVSPEGETASAPQIFIHPGGGQTLTWTDTVSTPGTVHLRTGYRPSADSGWSSATTIASDSGNSSVVQNVVERPDGRAVALWIVYAADPSAMPAAYRAVRSADRTSWAAPETVFGSGAVASLVATTAGDLVQTTTQGADFNTLAAVGSHLLAGSPAWSSLATPVPPGGVSGFVSPTARPDGSVVATLISGASLLALIPGLATWSPDTHTWAVTKQFASESVNSQAGFSSAADDEGNVAVAWQRANGDNVVAAGDGAGPDLLSLSAPASGAAGTPLEFSAGATDRLTAVAQIRWSFGDGTPAVTGDSVSHSFSGPGSYAVTVTATDEVGNRTTATRNVTIAASPTLEVDPAPATATPTPHLGLRTPARLEAVLKGRTITLNVKIALKHGRRCHGTVVATTRFARRSYRSRLRLKTAAGACRATGRLQLKKTPSTRTKLRVAVKDGKIRSRTVTTRRR